MDDTYLQILEGMELEERKLFLQSEAVIEEKTWLEQMLGMNTVLADESKEMAELARQNLLDYETYKDMPDAVQFLESAEFYKELALDLKREKYSIKDIRKQRERVQWEVKKMNELKKITESKLSSKTSRSSSPSS